MALQVTGSTKDRDGDIIGICGYGWNHTKSTAVSNIRLNRTYYYVSVAGRNANVRVGTRNGLPYLTTAPDDYSPNNLASLGGC